MLVRQLLLNKTRALGYMERYGIDALVASTPANVKYFTGYAGWVHRIYREYESVPGQSSMSRQAYGILCFDDPQNIGLIVPIAIANFVAQHDLWSKDLMTYGRYENSIESTIIRPEEIKFKKIIDSSDRNASEPGQALVKMLRERRLDNAVIGLDTENISPSAMAYLQTGLPNATIRNASELIRFVRMVKTDEEIIALKCAAELNERAYAEFVENVRPGVTELELKQVVRETIAKGGGDFKFCNCPFGTRAGGFFPPNDTKLALNEVIWFDFGCSVDSYNADTGGTIIVGAPSDRLRSTYATLSAAEAAAIDASRPGTKPSQIAKIIDDVVIKRGLNPPRPLGHGIGLDEKDYPLILRTVNPTGVQDGFLKESTDITLEEGMVINQEVPYHVLGWGGTQIERTIVVSKDGGKPLIRQDRVLHIK